MSEKLVRAVLERERRKAPPEPPKHKRRTLRKIEVRRPADEPSHVEWQAIDGH